MAVFGEIAQLIAGGKLKSRIQATYSIDRIKDAVGAAAAGERDGKILIVPNA
jgi:NADPH:quinone reductase-like Zn-dependent oxidoreductase